jgi:hypothetical protein
MLCCSGLLVLLFTAMFHDLCRWHVAGRPVKRVISAQQHVQLARFGFQPSPMKGTSLLAVWLHSFLYIACSSALGTALQPELLPCDAFAGTGGHAGRQPSRRPAGGADLRAIQNNMASPSPCSLRPGIRHILRPQRRDRLLLTLPMPIMPHCISHVISAA